MKMPRKNVGLQSRPAGTGKLKVKLVLQHAILCNLSYDAN